MGDINPQNCPWDFHANVIRNVDHSETLKDLVPVVIIYDETNNNEFDSQWVPNTSGLQTK